MATANIESHVDLLYRAFDEKELVDPITDSDDLTVEDAYAIQEGVIDRILGADGETAGYKLGLVSGAKQAQLGIDEPIFCPVPQELLIEPPHLDLDDCIKPRLEAEIGLVLGETLEPPVTSAEVIAKTQRVVPVIEIIESRYKDWNIPTAEDVIADITSCRRVFLGNRALDVGDVDLAMEGITLTHNGELVETGIGADIMGNPAAGVSWLAERLAQRGDVLSAGDLLMTGGITAAVDIEPGDIFNVHFSTLGSIDVVAQ